MEKVDVGGHALRADSTGTGPPTFVCLHGLVDSPYAPDNPETIYCEKCYLSEVY